MSKTCGDCVYCGANWRWENAEHCQKMNRDVEYDSPACPYFKADSDGCCYDCDYFKSGLISGGKCTLHRKSVSCPSSYVCSDFSG